MPSRDIIAPRCTRRDPRRVLACAVLAGLIVLLAGATRAGAVILPATTIDGPSQNIVAFGGVAMAADGTGGVVYLKRVEGVAHVFVARYVGGHWLAPIRVDTEDPYAASWPRIGAADGGELVVVWATPFATEEQRPVDELLSSTLGPGSQAFGPAIIVDPDIGEGAGTSPDLAMSSSGQADVVYRVIVPSNGVSLLRPGDVAESVRVAHFGGERWIRMGAINRDPGLGMRPPTAANAPAIAIGPTGNGVVVWQEPEINGDHAARIWARRLFGAGADYVLPVSATTFGPSPIEEDADAPSVAVSPVGQAEVAYRQDAGPSSPLPGPRVFINILSNGEAVSGAEFEGPVIADNAVPGGKAASVGRPSIDINERESVRLMYDDNGQPRVVEGTDLGLTGTLTLGSPFVGSSLAAASELPSASVMGPEGGGISAWPSTDSQGALGVGVREDFLGGGVQTGFVSGGAGGPIGELQVGRSGLGDGLVAFQQGQIGNAAIVAAQVSATPEEFVTSSPKGWIRPSQAEISWEPAPTANGPVTYTVVLDGHRLPTPTGVFSLRINPHLLASGLHSIQLLATDRYGQATLTTPATLRIDGTPPRVTIVRTAGDTAVAVSVTDNESGLQAGAVRISFGDGHHASGQTHLRHRYAHAGTYEIVVSVRDRLGNSAVVRRRVKLR